MDVLILMWTECYSTYVIRIPKDSPYSRVLFISYPGRLRKTDIERYVCMEHDTPVLVAIRLVVDQQQTLMPLLLTDSFHPSREG